MEEHLRKLILKSSKQGIINKTQKDWKSIEHTSHIRQPKIVVKPVDSWSRQVGWEFWLHKQYNLW